MGNQREITIAVGNIRRAIDVAHNQTLMRFVVKNGFGILKPDTFQTSFAGPAATGVTNVAVKTAKADMILYPKCMIILLVKLEKALDY